MKTITSFVLAVVAGVCVLHSAPFQAPDVYDLVIANGRVIDPDSGLDGVRHIGVAGGVVRAVASERLDGRATIDASGLVVAPGFIDPKNPETVYVASPGHLFGPNAERGVFKTTDGRQEDVHEAGHRVAGSLVGREVILAS